MPRAGRRRRQRLRRPRRPARRRRFPTRRCQTLRNVDHFATPESFGFIDAALEFLEAVPDGDSPRRPTSTARVAALARGGLVAIPTETVYGLAADAADRPPSRRIFEVKGRPAGPSADRPHRRRRRARRLGGDVPAGRRARLADACWPGPLTVLLPRWAARARRRHRRSRLGRAARARPPADAANCSAAPAPGSPRRRPTASGGVSPTTAAHVARRPRRLGSIPTSTSCSTAARARSASRARSSTAPSTRRRSCVRAASPTSRSSALLGADLADARPGRAGPAGCSPSHYAPRGRGRAGRRSQDAADADVDAGPAAVRVVLDGTDDLARLRPDALRRQLRAADDAGASASSPCCPPAAARPRRPRPAPQGRGTASLSAVQSRRFSTATQDVANRARPAATGDPAHEPDRQARRWSRRRRGRGRAGTSTRTARSGARRVGTAGRRRSPRRASRPTTSMASNVSTGSASIVNDGMSCCRRPAPHDDVLVDDVAESAVSSPSASSLGRWPSSCSARSAAALIDAIAAVSPPASG